jgi:hypothetical protein
MTVHYACFPEHKLYREQKSSNNTKLTFFVYLDTFLYLSKSEDGKLNLVYLFINY